MLMVFTIALELVTVVIVVEGNVVLPGVRGVEAGCSRGEVCGTYSSYCCYILIFIFNHHIVDIFFSLSLSIIF